MRSLRGVLDLILPDRCAGCAAPGGAWCADCARSLAGGPLPVDGLGPPPAYALARYGGAARRAVLAYKERNRRELARHLGLALASALPVVLDGPIRAGPVPPSLAATSAALSRAGPVLSGRGSGAALPAVSERPAGAASAAPVVLVPAPSRPGAARRRGGQHMLAVAERCAAFLRGAGLRASVAPALRLSGRALDSVGLDAAGRAANLAGRLRPVPSRAPQPGSRVILLDDVITTGATVAACVSALASVAAPVAAVLAITVAR